MNTSRTVRHVVLVKFKPEASLEHREELMRLSQWGRNAEYVAGYKCGVAVKPNPYAGQTEEWDWGMSLDLSEDDVNRYRDDPVHEAIPEEVIACAEKFEILDFIID